MSQFEQAQEFFTKLADANKKAFELQTAFGEQFTADVTQYYTDLGEVVKGQFEQAPAATDFNAAIEAANSYNASVKTLTEALVAERTEAATALQEELKSTFEFLVPKSFAGQTPVAAKKPRAKQAA